jgi:hypothetical protein
MKQRRLFLLFHGIAVCHLDPKRALRELSEALLLTHETELRDGSLTDRDHRGGKRPAVLIQSISTPGAKHPSGVQERKPTSNVSQVQGEVRLISGDVECPLPFGWHERRLDCCLLRPRLKFSERARLVRQPLSLRGDALRLLREGLRPPRSEERSYGQANRPDGHERLPSERPRARARSCDG